MLALASTMTGAEAGDASHWVTALESFVVGGEAVEAAANSTLPKGRVLWVDGVA
jgi:hypothetical protein